MSCSWTQHSESQMIYLESNTYIIRPVLHCDILYVVVQLFEEVKAFCRAFTLASRAFIFDKYGFYFSK